MKMHTRAMVRHTQPVELCELVAEYFDGHPEPYHICVGFPGSRTSRLTMTESEARTLFESLGAMLRYADTPASVVTSDDWADMHHHLKLAIGKENK